MALGTDFHLDEFLGRTDGKGVSASALDPSAGIVFGMNIFFHTLNVIRNLILNQAVFLFSLFNCDIYMLWLKKKKNQK